MDKNKFYELAARVLANEANSSEQECLNNLLEVRKYRKLFEWLKAEWEKEVLMGNIDFDYETGIERLRSKIAASEEKAVLQTRVIPMKRRLSQIAAISILLITSSIIYLQFRTTEPKITAFAENNKQGITSGETRLILNGREEIEILSKNAEIDYSSKDGIVVVNDLQEIKQDIKQDETTYNTVIVPYGKRSKITLADNSVVWLNSGSKFIYPAKFSQKKREVFLEGEALFEVEHDTNKPFTVLTNNIEIKVLGTVFNVSAYSDDAFTNTVLESGSVEIDYPGKSRIKHRKLRIEPGTSAIYNLLEKTIQKKKVNPKYYTSWREGILLYQHQSLEEIVKKLSRYYNTNIQIENQELAITRFSGKLDLKEDVQKVLETIAFASDLEIVSKNNQLIIKN